MQGGAVVRRLEAHEHRAAGIVLESKSGAGLNQHIGRGASRMTCAGRIPLDVENDELRVPRLQRGGVLTSRNPWIILPTDQADVGGFEQRREALLALNPPKDRRAAPPYFVSRVHLIEGF